MRSVRRMVRCEGIVLLAMPCYPVDAVLQTCADGMATVYTLIRSVLKQADLGSHCLSGRSVRKLRVLTTFS